MQLQNTSEQTNPEWAYFIRAHIEFIKRQQVGTEFVLHNIVSGVYLRNKYHSLSI